MKILTEFDNFSGTCYSQGNKSDRNQVRYVDECSRYLIVSRIVEKNS